MSETVHFLNMFSMYEPPEALKSVLSQAAVVAADIDPSKRRVQVCIHTDAYIPAEALKQISTQVKQTYGLQDLEITATHPADQLSKMEPDALREMFVAQNSMNMGSLAGARWEWEGEALTVYLVGNGKKELEDAAPAVCRQLRERFAAPVTIRIVAGENLEGQALFDAMEKIRGSAMREIPKTSAAAPAQKSAQSAPSEAIYGKPFKGQSVPMEELTLDMGNVIVEGRVFSVEHKELKKRNAWVVNFDMTDNRGSVRINRFMETAEAKPILEGVKKGAVLRVQGKLMVNNFDNEMVLKPYSIMPGTMQKRKDNAPGEKRVELHLHTAMSNMDAVTKTADAIKQAAAWGHRTIAITDHGCCQSFTDALHVVEDWKGPPKVAGTNDTIKILYGCEGYYINDVDDRIAVCGSRDMTYDQEYVAFDLETTGLYPRQDRIIEIGAVIMKNGVEIDRFQTFVDPQRPLDKTIVDLTGITDECSSARRRSRRFCRNSWSLSVTGSWSLTMRTLIRHLFMRNAPDRGFPIH